MKTYRNSPLILGFVLSVSLIASALTAVLISTHFQKAQYHMLENICRELLEEQPGWESSVSAALKEYKNHPADNNGNGLLSELGFRPADFGVSAVRQSRSAAGIGFLCGAFLFLLTFICFHRKETMRIRDLYQYLERVNTGKPGAAFSSREDEFSKLQDEIYRTVTMLYQTRDAALEAKKHFAENLANIAHQLKTPITAISLSAQMLKNYPCRDYPQQIQKSLSRLTHLEEALLVLSRIDAGTLLLERRDTDIFTILMLAADNLQELLEQSGVSVDIPELGQAEVTVDLDWTMEAVMNLMKNAMEHTPPGGQIHCTYEKNPLYAEIILWDEGHGFAKEDIPRLFERFYRGQNAGEGGIGIGLALSKEIIEKQNGTIRARNMPQGGACFEIRFYSH